MIIIYIIILIIIINIIYIIWKIYFLYKDPYFPYLIAHKWNEIIKNDCDKQDSDTINKIPSYYNANNSNNDTITKLHNLININHDLILQEVLETLKTYKGYPHSNIDDVQKLLFDVNNKNNWKCIWIRFLNQWVNTSDKIPTLKNIVSLFPNITLINISIFNPGTILPEHTGITRSVQRYHYGLKIPKGDVGLKIDGHLVNWVEKEGFVWDDTIKHSAWNNTNEPRIIIFADVLRELPYIKTLGSKIVYNMIRKTKHTIEIKKKLDAEGIIID